MEGPLKSGKKGYNEGMPAHGKYSTKGRTIGMNVGKNIGDSKGEKWKKKIGKYGYHSKSGLSTPRFVLGILVAWVLIATLMIFFGPSIPVAKAQEGSTVNLYQGPPKDPTETILFYSGTNLQYLCVAPSIVSRYQLSVSAATAASPTVLTITAHNWSLTPPITPLVEISGGTGNWTVLNGKFIATPVDADTLTLTTSPAGATVNCTGCGALTGTIVLKATAPRLNQTVWSIKKFFYDGSNNMIGGAWINGASGLSQACSNRAAAGFGWQ